MKRDMELVREILIQTEESGAEEVLMGDKMAEEVGGFSHEEVNYHIGIMVEGGLLDASITRSSTGMVVGTTIRRLTWEGHEFLDAARNSDIWAQVQDAASEKSLSLTIDVMKNALKHYTEEKLGLKE